MEAILLTGGCGYIGSHIAHLLSEKGEKPLIYDNLSSGFKSSLLLGQELIEGDLADKKKLEDVFSQHKIKAVIHLAASISVEESTRKPLFYYQNNTANTMNLLQLCLKYKVFSFIFSSTAAVYGDGYSDQVITEDCEPRPMNPYGHSKLMDEQIISDVSKASELSFIALRYFNVAGAHPKALIGQRTPEATHLIKLACEAACGLRKGLQVYGTDYKTPDGTGVRDYIHVMDLASAHLLALDALEKNKNLSGIYNCGYGKGHSVLEVLDMVQSLSDQHFAIQKAARRSGDAASIVAASDKIQKTLGWQPAFQDLKEIVLSALNWEKKLQNELLN